MVNAKRITVFVGYYGSGKTEGAVNYALELKKQGKDVVIVDFDIVNPYFRTLDAEKLLTDNGIKVIAPQFANSNIESPSLPADIYSVFTNKDCYVIFDVGGGEDGAIPLGRYFHQFMQEDIDVFFVLNQRRLLTADLEGAVEAYNEIAAVCRIPITGIINNTHLKEYTTPEIILEVQELAEKTSDELGLPIAYITGTSENLEKLPKEYEDKKLPIHLYINLMF